MGERSLAWSLNRQKWCCDLNVSTVIWINLIMYSDLNMIYVSDQQLAWLSVYIKTILTGREHIKPELPSGSSSNLYIFLREQYE